MKRTAVLILLIALSSVIILPAILTANMVSAQTGYTIQNVDHQIEVMFSGYTVVRDTITLSGQTSSFQIGFPERFGSSILNVVAYDNDNNSYPVNSGVQLGGQGGFYAVEVNFNGQSPQVFSVAFVFSNSLVTETDVSLFSLDFPAYPSFTTAASKCNVTVALSGVPNTINITKSDGNINSAAYVKDNLPAFTNIAAQAVFDQPTGILELCSVSQLNRQVTVNPAGQVFSSDSYRVTGNSAYQINSLIIGLPVDASNTIVRDEFGNNITSEIVGIGGNSLIVNATLGNPLTTGKSTTLTAQYNLPSTSTNSNYKFNLFQDPNYLFNQATVTFTPPEGAKITAPQASSLDSSSSLTTNGYQDTLTINRQKVSYIEYYSPALNTIQITYSYNPLWSSYRPTFWSLILAVVGCVGILFWRKFKPTEKAPVKIEPKRLAEPAMPTKQAQEKTAPSKTNIRITADTVRGFSEAYEDRKAISAELKSLDSRAQKGKIPRRQYKVQRNGLGVRSESLTRNINELKELFRNSGSAYADLIRQLDNAEADLNEAEENLKTNEIGHNSGEISIENYKQNIIDFQKQKDKAESTISGILLRLREKIH